MKGDGKLASHYTGNVRHAQAEEKAAFEKSSSVEGMYTHAKYSVINFFIFFHEIDITGNSSFFSTEIKLSYHIFSSTNYKDIKSELCLTSL